MKKLFSLSFLSASILILSLSSCKDDDDDNQNIVGPPAPDPFENHELLGSAGSDHDDNRVFIYGDRPAFTGYNRLLIAYRDSDDKLLSNFDGESVAVMPEMEMPGGMSHSAPIRVNTFDDDGALKTDIVFVMPSTAGDWYINVYLLFGSEETDTITYRVPVTVSNPEEERVKSFIAGADSIRYFVSLVDPLNPETGKNNFEIAVHARKSAYSWPVVNGLAFEMEPEMPAMGHGSPENEHPVNTFDGHYKGVVNFTMTGYWKVNLVMSENDEVLNDELYFDITF